jgi:hypothetical protein
MFFSASPTNLDMIDGPFTLKNIQIISLKPILGSLDYKVSASFLAIKVLPVPGGP